MQLSYLKPESFYYLLHFNSIFSQEKLGFFVFSDFYSPYLLEQEKLGNKTNFTKKNSGNLFVLFCFWALTSVRK